MAFLVGTCDWFGSKGQSFGFINYKIDDKWRQVYVHYKNIGTMNLRPQNKSGSKYFRELKRGDVVSFELSPGFGMPNGSQAVNVEILLHANRF